MPSAGSHTRCRPSGQQQSLQSTRAIPQLEPRTGLWITTRKVGERPSRSAIRKRDARSRRFHPDVGLQQRDFLLGSPLPQWRCICNLGRVGRGVTTNVKSVDVARRIQLCFARFAFVRVPLWHTRPSEMTHPPNNLSHCPSAPPSFAPPLLKQELSGLAQSVWHVGVEEGSRREGPTPKTLGSCTTKASEQAIIGPVESKFMSRRGSFQDRRGGTS